MSEASGKGMSSRRATGWFYVGLAVLAALGYWWAAANGKGSAVALLVSLAWLALGISTIKSGE